MNQAQQKHFQSLHQQHLNALLRQGKAESTIDAYSRAVRRITEFFDLCPDQLTTEHLKSYFTALIGSHSWSSVKLDRNGLQFFYQHVLQKEWQWIDIVKPPRERTLPDLLTRSEVEFVINHTRELRYQTYILTAYSMGLRLGEALNLTVSDIDSPRMKVHVRQGKGRKDRFVTLPEVTLHALRNYWKTHRHPRFIFPAGVRPELRPQVDKVMDRGGLQKSFKAIVQSCGIHKRISLHTLRHCYGAHLLEAGIHLRKIQTEMGHVSPKTTALYTQLTDEVEQHSGQLINQLFGRMHINWVGGQGGGQ